MRKFLSVALAVVLLVVGSSRGLAVDPQQVFTQPPDRAKAGAWWHWMGCNVTREGITKDLEAFKAAGIHKVTIFGMADVCTPWAGHIENSPTDGLIAFTDPWWKLVRFAAQEARRLNLDLGMHNCPGYTHSGGPWIKPEHSMLDLCHSVTTFDSAEFSGTLARPTVDPRGRNHFPFVNKDTGKLEKPIVEARKTFYRDVTVLAMPADGTVPREKIINLSGKMNADGSLRWKPPTGGKWAIYRIGYTTMGSMTQPNQWEIRGLECDKMSVEANNIHLDHVLGEMKKHLGDLVGTGLRHVLFDSYEAGEPTWTPKMIEEFMKRRGYDPTVFLATFAGRTIESENDTKKFKDDFGRTMRDLYRDVHFAVTAKRLREVGLEFACEPYGGPFVTGEVTPYLDRVMTEFWSGDDVKPVGVGSGFFNGPGGKRHNIIEAEAFTGGPEQSKWDEHPGRLKLRGDAAYIGGINRFILHSAAHQPWDDRYVPGNSMGRWGTHFSRTQTWWEPGKAWFDYLQRCQALLQWGELGERGNFKSSAKQIVARHRTGPEAQVFFLSNQSKAAATARCSFNITSKQPELWDPVTGQMRDLPQFSDRGGRTEIMLQFAPAQSYFIVFRKPTNSDRAATHNFPAHNLVTELTGPWSVSFDPKWGGPAQITFDQLIDWTTHSEPGIRYYSGTATYRKSFDGDRGSFLDLGSVPHLARVRINGRDLGVVWTAPMGVSIPPGLLKPTGNKLEIEVTNVWANRLIGDEQEPADCEWTPGHISGGSYLKRFPDWFKNNEPRPSKGRYCFVMWNYFNKDSKLVPSGLMGPVRVVAEDWTSPQPEAQLPPSPHDALPQPAQLVRIKSVDETGVAHTGGGDSPSALFNLSIDNGSGDTDTADDGKTFRGYQQGSTVTLHLDGPHHLTEIRTFTGHDDARASQNYTVELATADAPANFKSVLTVDENSSGGMIVIKRPLTAQNVTAVRLVFKNGPSGFNVYREICILGKPAQ
jgi:hypothetical protein